MAVAIDKVMEQREAKLKTALKELGSGKNKVAETLKAKKIKGCRNTSDDCPVAKYVKKLFPRATSIEVDTGSVSVGFKDDEYIDVNLPKAVGAFIEAFDDGDYDFLSTEAA